MIGVVFPHPWGDISPLDGSVTLVTSTGVLQHEQSCLISDSLGKFCVSQIIDWFVSSEFLWHPTLTSFPQQFFRKRHYGTSMIYSSKFKDKHWGLKNLIHTGSPGGFFLTLAGICSVIQMCYHDWAGGHASNTPTGSRVRGTWGSFIFSLCPSSLSQAHLPWTNDASVFLLLSWPQCLGWTFRVLLTWTGSS